jgi:hypothetical protein
MLGGWLAEHSRTFPAPCLKCILKSKATIFCFKQPLEDYVMQAAMWDGVITGVELFARHACSMHLSMGLTTKQQAASRLLAGVRSSMAPLTAPLRPTFQSTPCM